jgi:hypothetical protein
MAKSRASAGGNNYPENGLVKPPRRDTRALSPAGMFGGNPSNDKNLLQVRAQKMPYLTNAEEIYLKRLKTAADETILGDEGLLAAKGTRSSSVGYRGGEGVVGFEFKKKLEL